MRIYVACGLTHVPRDDFPAHVSFIHGLAEYLARGLAAEVKYALRDSDPQLATKPLAERPRLCYLWDREMVEWADVLIAECTYPSVGLGIELQIAEQRGTPIIISFRRSAKTQAPPVQYDNPDHSRHTLQIGHGYVSFMALGLPGLFKTIDYVTPEEGLPAILEAASLLKKKAIGTD
jgi:hypothetical protein